MKSWDMLISENEELKEEVQRLREQLSKAYSQPCKCKVKATAKNSSKPPSTDFKANAKNPPCKGGAQPGHPGHVRQLLPKERVDKQTIHTCQRCLGCQSSNLVETTEGIPAQTYDLQVGRLVVEEHRRKRYRCQSCQKRFSAPLPKQFQSSLFSPSIQAMIGTLTGHFHLSKAQVKNLLKELFSVPISVGAICRVERRLTAALQPAYREIKEEVQKGKNPFFGTSYGWIIPY